MDALLCLLKLLLFSLFANVSMGRPTARRPCPFTDKNCLGSVVSQLMSWKEVMDSKHNKEITSLKEEISAMKNESLTLKNESSLQTKELTALKNESSSQKKEIMVLKKESLSLNNDSLVQKMELAALNKEVAKLHEKIAVLNESHQDIYPENCVELYKLGFRRSGVYTVSIEDTQQVVHNVPVFCDMDTTTGGWTVFQRRQDGSVPFNRTWEEYKRGFGDLESEFWLGNSYLAMITASKRYTLRVDLVSFDNEKRYAEYQDFRISGEADKYRLSIGSYSGTAGDREGLSYQNQSQFSTVDEDNDGHGSYNCALNDGGGGFWYKSCKYVNLNGRYRHSPESDYKGINWYAWLSRTTLKHTEMKLKPIE